MSDFKERLLTEKKELADKISKLQLFIVSPNFDKIDIGQQDLLNKQLPAMQEYCDIVTERIELIS